ncbi:MAG: hypothetical protein M3R62_14730 [Acidobacteriota bacterium]|nr:hypothetical protein [Acidobacteriota bacterium]
MRRSIAVGLLIGAWAIGGAVAAADDKKDEKKARVAMRDDCDPSDRAWTPTGGCTLKGGDVTSAEFGQFLFSTLSHPDPGVIGHSAWRMDPTYLKTEAGETVKVKNLGGRGHTFTFVQNFGGGFITPLNGDMNEAPECGAAADHILPPGASQEVTGLTVGNHRFQCCIHPWMRILIKVKPDDEEHEHGH